MRPTYSSPVAQRKRVRAAHDEWQARHAVGEVNSIIVPTFPGIVTLQPGTRLGPDEIESLIDGHAD